MPAGRRLGLQVPLLVGREPADYNFELQRFLEALLDGDDEGIPAGNYEGTPAILTVGGAGVVGDPLDGWSPGLHEHPIPTGVPAALGAAEAGGSSTSFPRLDHVHARAILGRLDDADIGIQGALNFLDSSTIDFTVTEDVPNGELEIVADVIPSGISHGDLADLGPPADDHPQYLHLPGRAGGQQAFGGTGSLEELQLRGTTNANLGFIRMQAPVIFDGYTSNPSAAYAFQYNAAEGTVGVFVGGGLSMQGSITSGASTFIYESFRGAPTITTGANPGFAAYTVLQALPTLIAGAGAGHNPIAPLILNAGVTVRNPFAGTRTVSAVAAINFASTLHTSTAGAVLNCTNWTGMTVAPKWNTVGGSTVNFGTIRGLWCQTPGQALFGSSAGAETMAAYYGVQVDNITIPGIAPRAALRSSISAGTNRFFLLNPGGAPSDFQAGTIHVNDGTQILFGNAVPGDVGLLWNGAGNTFDILFATTLDRLAFSSPSADRFIVSSNAKPNEIDFDFEKFAFGQASAVGNQVGIFVAPTRTVGVPGGWADFLLTQAGNLDLNGNAMSDVFAWAINAPSIVASGGSAAQAGALQVAGNVGVATERYGVLIRSIPSGGTENWGLRTLGPSRIDRLLRFDQALEANTTTVTGTTHTAGDEHVILVDDDTAGAQVTVTLPLAATGRRIYHVKKLGTTANVVVDGNGAETIDGALTQTISVQYDSLMLVSDGTGWWVI